MSKYKSGDKFILEIESDRGDGWYGIKGFDEYFIEPEAMLNKLERYYPPCEEYVGTLAFKPHRIWQQLVQEPDDMTADEKARLKRIKAIPPVAFDAAREREEQLREQVRELEAEIDKICDFLNGEAG